MSLYAVILTLFALTRNVESLSTNFTNNITEISPENDLSRSEAAGQYQNPPINFTQDMEEIEPPRALPLAAQMATAISALDKKAGSSNVTMLKNRNQTINGSFVNGTGYFLENDEIDNSFTDVQTLFLACFATLMPLVLLLMMIFLIRFLWRRSRRGYGVDGEAGRVLGGAPNGDASTDPLAKAALHQSCEELKSADCLFPLPNSDNSTEAARTITAPNGSVITMTLQDNHLIVETMTEDALESPSVETEVSSQADTGSVIHVEMDHLKTALTPGGRISTGLSQSDLSLSSSDSYRYGNQLGYEAGYYGYPLTDVSPCAPKATEFREPPLDGDKPIIRSALLKQDSLQIDSHQQRLNSDACAFERRMEAKRVIEEEEENEKMAKESEQEDVKLVEESIGEKVNHEDQN